MGNIPFITVEGPIGAGKTSLAQAISRHFKFHLLKEIVDENPFLNKFYEDIDEWSFQTEMFFLCNRYKQLEDIQSKVLSEKQSLVADYHIFKNLIFATRTLKGEQLDKYVQIYDILTKDMPAPNMVIYIHASLDTLLSRISMRGREFEKGMDPAYLQQLSSDYERFMNEFEEKHPHTPIIRINGDEVDFVKKQADLSSILDEISKRIKKEQ
ncbi:deoxyguanosine kinase [Bacillus ectoiniformans]|uniref:deoxynucleoside kinase n=1 Tax=Bacillus ectoiniformans TaxID=1494429 RepID=UPI00195F0BCE|nr:deoxynucleoside kinase [Bacillus ectoiniformans]MBM7650497.1 deoxyguanosine kinase [Bacillus ectoiniformans]